MTFEMIRRIIRISTYVAIFLPLLFSGSLAYGDSTATAEALWIDPQSKRQEIKFAQLIDGDWYDEQVVYQSDNALTSLALGTAPSGEKLMIWTEQKRAKTALMYMTASNTGGTLQWSTPSVFSDKGHENFSASIVYDLAGTAWVFWASTHEDFSDIVLRKYSGSWEQIEKVHAKNSVPDIKPSASIIESGEVSIEWDSYDFEAGNYIRRNKQYSGAINLGEDSVKLLIDKVIPSDVQFPPNMYTGAQALLHFPSNQMIQSVLYSQGS